MLPRELSYIILFLIQFLIGLSFVVWHEVGRVTTDDVVETTLNILQRTGGTVALFVVMTYVAIESWRMLAERYEQRRYREGKAEGKAEGRAEGKAEGKAEGVEAVLTALDEKTRKDVERKLRLDRGSEDRD